MAETTRKSRTQEMREAEDAYDAYNDTWEEKGILDTTEFPAREGFEQKWVRTADRGGEDADNVYRKMRQGFKVRALDTVPNVAKVPKTDFEGTQVIGFRNMVLMERPKKIGELERQKIRSRTDAQQQAVDQNLFKVHAKGSGITRPVIKHDSSVSKGRVAIADD